MLQTKKETLSQTAYDARKKVALDNEIMRKQISLSEFHIIDNETIEINGKRIQITPAAFQKILKRLRIPKAFAKRFQEGFGTKALKNLVAMMKTQKSSKNDQEVTLIVDPKERVITNVLPAGYASISNEGFLDFVERFISGYNLNVVNFGSDNQRGTVINTLTDNKIFQVPGMDDEVFNTGVTFRNTPDKGLQVTPFLDRLICANGWTSTAFSETFGLHQFTENSIKEFNEHMMQMANTGFQPMGIAETIQKANGTPASMKELQYAANSIMGYGKDVNYDYIQRYAPIERANVAYQNAGITPSEMTNKQMANAKSGMSVWDVVNGVTNFASNDERYGVNDMSRTNLMMKAGNMLLKKNYDMENIIDVDPFTDRNLLSERETKTVRGDS